MLALPQKGQSKMEGVYGHKPRLQSKLCTITNSRTITATPRLAVHSRLQLTKTRVEAS